MFSIKFDEKGFRKKVGQAVAKTKVDIPCPECSTKNGVSMGGIASQMVITCCGCQKTIKLIDEGGEFKRIVEGR